MIPPSLFFRQLSISFLKSYPQDVLARIYKDKCKNICIIVLFEIAAY